MSSANNEQTFWREAFAIQGSITPRVMPYVLVCGAVACVICLTSWLTERWFSMDIGLEVTPFELAGAALGLLLILRTNSGYDRWWEAPQTLGRNRQSIAQRRNQRRGVWSQRSGLA